MTRCIECGELVDAEEPPCNCGRCEDCCSAALPEMRDDDPSTYAYEEDDGDGCTR